MPQRQHEIYSAAEIPLQEQHEHVPPASQNGHPSRATPRRPVTTRFSLLTSHKKETRRRVLSTTHFEVDAGLAVEEGCFLVTVTLN